MEENTIRQIALFLENRSGRLNEALALLSSNNINIVALTIADTSDYGIMRFIVSDPQKALDVLRGNGFSVNVNHVLSLELGMEAGSLSAVMEKFSEAGVSIEYMYAFSFGTKAVMVMRTDNRPAALEIVRRNNFRLITEQDLY